MNKILWNVVKTLANKTRQLPIPSHCIDGRHWPCCQSTRGKRKLFLLNISFFCNCNSVQRRVLMQLHMLVATGWQIYKIPIFKLLRLSLLWDTKRCAHKPVLSNFAKGSCSLRVCPISGTEWSSIHLLTRWFRTIYFKMSLYNNK